MKLNFVQTLSTRFGQYFEVDVQAKFWNWSLVSILLLRLGEVMKWMFGQDFEVKVWSKCWCLVKILNLIKICVRTQPSGPLCLWQCFLQTLTTILANSCFGSTVCKVLFTTFFCNLLFQRIYLLQFNVPDWFLLSPSSPILGQNWKYDLARSWFILIDFFANFIFS